MLGATLRQFQTLQLVVEAGSFSKAAQKLGISQAAISKHILALEGRLGFAVFARRRGAAVESTEQGSAILGQVSSLLRSADRVQAAAEQTTRQQRKIRILAGRFLAQLVIMPSLGRLRVQRPDLIIELTTIDSPRRVFEPAQRASADLIYVSLLDPRLAASAELIVTAPLIFVASPSHQVISDLASGGTVRLPMIMGVPGESSDALIRQALMMSNITNYYAAHNVQLPEVMVSLAVAGEGVCCTMPPMIRSELQQGTLVELALPRPTLYRLALRNPVTWSDDMQYVDQFIRSLISAAI